MPTPPDLVLRDAAPTDIDAITRIVASGPDAAADWTFPGLRQRAEEARPLHVRAFTRVFKNRQNLLRVAEREGKVVGYCAWVKRQLLGEEVVAVDLTDGYDEQALDAESLRLSGSDPLPKFTTLMPSHPTRSPAIALLRANQSPEPCLSLPSYQLLVLGVSEPLQGQGIGGALIREGLALGAQHSLPVFVTGEGRGMRVYRHLGFQVLEGTWHGFDADGKQTEREEDAREEQGGLDAAQMVAEE
ncbi:hypothetical protein LMH87_001625 [Akanthomyces muscarius]|uniref:N-acetyltransferase domain-containing protein n=1 Tax=Akanthomyces muscarius TaxID=2231603 RepID=A0A9W8Q7Z1_AKAMU|nr:hypothetical protein LMH87_001625 [Akanthomyces muscarius]KAJ4147076.1 hypothetical protein LMH87_001625 [Akanthomyces muscarius]